MSTPLEAAIAARDEFLEKNPQLRAQQEEIDRILDSTPDDQRMDVLSIMMSTELLKLQKALLDLVSTVNPK